MSAKELMISNYIEIGSKVEILSTEQVNKIDGSVDRKIYHSSIMDLLDEEHIEMLMPMEKTKLILLQQDAEYELHFITSKGLFQCLARVTRRYKQEQLYMLEMELISDIQKYQRREYYRYSCSLEIGARDLTMTEQIMLERGQNFEPEELPFQKATTVDISGGGMRFVSSVPYEAGRGIVCNYSFERSGMLKTYSQIAHVLSCTRMERNNTMYEIRIRFAFINNHDREEIIRYIFEEERKRRKREL